MNIPENINISLAAQHYWLFKKPASHQCNVPIKMCVYTKTYTYIWNCVIINSQFLSKYLYIRITKAKGQKNLFIFLQ